MRCVKFAVNSLISAGKLDTAIVLLPFEFVKGWIYRSVMAKKKRKPLNANEVIVVCDHPPTATTTPRLSTVPFQYQSQRCRPPTANVKFTSNCKVSTSIVVFADGVKFPTN